MIKITDSQDCRNSPKNRFVQEAAVALESGRLIAGQLSDKVVWHGPAANPLVGIAAVKQVLSARQKPVAIVVEHAIAHGKAGMANGHAALADGTRRRFSHVFDFTSAKGNCIAVISSYA